MGLSLFQVRKMLGRKASALMSMVLLVYGYGSAIAYLIILGDCFQPMFAEAFGDTWYTARCASFCPYDSLVQFKHAVHPAVCCKWPMPHLCTAAHRYTVLHLLHLLPINFSYLGCSRSGAFLLVLAA